MDDKELVIRAQNGEKDAFGLLYQKYFQKIFRYCSFNTNSEELAKDICQESFVKAYKKLKDFRTEGQWSIQAFLFAIARNLIIDHSRKKKEVSVEGHEEMASTENLYDNFEKKENAQKVRAILQRLDEVERHIIMLRYFEEMSTADVAKIIGINEGALRVRASRAMQKMKALYESTYGKRN